MMENLSSLIESLLFVSSKPIKYSYLAKFLDISEEIIIENCKELQKNKRADGIVVLTTENTVQLATNPQYSEVVTKYLTTDLREALSESSLEVFTIIAYKTNASKSEIENIRGVNSQYAIRQLLMRGLIEKTPSPTDSRMFNYRLTTEALSFLGIQSHTDLHEYQKVQETLSQIATNN